MENKQAICSALCETLKLTSAFQDLEALEYQQSSEWEETVQARFKGGARKRAVVSGDSGAAMIKDVIRQLMYR